MSLSSPAPALVLTLTLLAGPALAQPAAARCEPELRHLSLERQPPAAPPEVCVRAGRSTTLLFDTPLVAGAVLLEGRERFRQVEVAGRALVLVPGDTLSPGTRLRLEVFFQERGAPERATFLLVASPVAERQVEVSRPPPLPEVDLEQQRLELQQCRQERAVLEAQQARPPSLAEVISRIPLDMPLTFQHSLRPVQGLAVPTQAELNTFLFRGRGAIRLRLALPPGEEALSPARATLTGALGGPVELALLPPPSSPTGPGARLELFLDVPRAALSVPGPFTLTLWEASGTRSWRIPDVRFP